MELGGYPVVRAVVCLPTVGGKDIGNVFCYPENLHCADGDHERSYKSKFLINVNSIMGFKSVDLIFPALSVFRSYLEYLLSFGKVHCPLNLITDPVWVVFLC